MSLLTEHELTLVRESWELVLPDLKRHSVNYYISMFLNYPEWQDRFFLRLKGMTISQLRTDPVLAAHSSHVFHVVANLVDNLDNTDEIIEGAKKIARTHWPLNIRIPVLSAGCKLLEDYLKAALKDKMSDKCAAAWSKVLNALVSVMAEEQERLDREGLDLGGWSFKPGMEKADESYTVEHHRIYGQKKVEKCTIL